MQGLSDRGMHRGLAALVGAAALARLTGNYENTEVYHAMAGALGVTRR